MKNINNFDAEELISKGIISRETAEAIQAYYSQKENSPNNRLYIAFGILGSLLVGLGIILMLAHNWDQLSRLTKTIIAFLPLLLPQMLVWFTLTKKRESVAWSESSAVLLTLGIGTTISLVSQIYHIPGDIDSFLLTWILLSLPLIYLLSSSAASLLSIIGITLYTMLTSDGKLSAEDPLIYIALMSATIPHYLMCIKNKSTSNFTSFHHWFYAISPLFVLGFFIESSSSKIAFGYLSLFAILISIASFKFFESRSFWSNGYSIIGSLGLVVIMTIFGFEYMWNNEYQIPYSYATFVSNTSAITAGVITFFAALLAGNHLRIAGIRNARPELIAFILFLPVYFFGMSFPGFAQIMTNFLILGLGVDIAYRGAKQNHLGFMNYGLLITVLLAICRFFDDELSFVLRGSLFVAVGVGFFVSNYLLIRKMKQA